MRWNPVSAEINETFAIDLNETTTLISDCTLSHGLERFLTKNQANYTTGIQLITAIFHVAEGRNVLIQREDGDVYLAQQFALSQSAVFIHKCSSFHTSVVTVDNENVFLSLIWLFISLWQLFIAHFHCLGEKNKEHMKFWCLKDHWNHFYNTAIIRNYKQEFMTTEVCEIGDIWPHNTIIYWTSSHIFFPDLCP